MQAFGKFPINDIITKILALSGKIFLNDSRTKKKAEFNI